MLLYLCDLQFSQSHQIPDRHRHSHIVFLVSMLSWKPKTAFLKFSECTKVIFCQNSANSAGMCIIMVSSVCGIAYKNVTSRTHNGVQEVFTVKTSL